VELGLPSSAWALGKDTPFAPSLGSLAFQFSIISYEQSFFFTTSNTLRKCSWLVNCKDIIVPFFSSLITSASLIA
jgi:hypothetical protein